MAVNMTARMMIIMSKAANFTENYDGILNHNGEIRVAKGGVEQKLLNVYKDQNVLVKNKQGKSYVCDIHYKLKNMVRFAQKGDTAFIRFKMGKPYLIGFRKKNGM